jgi:sugar lactone lactonase YvrE
MNIVQKSRALGLSIGLIAASAVLVPISSTHAQDLYLGQSPGTITRITSDGTVIPFATGLISPTDIAFNASGEIFVADGFTGEIDRISSTGVVSAFASGATRLNNPRGLAFDASGNLFVSDIAAPITKFTPNGTSTTFVSAGIAQAAGIAFDTSGNLFVSDMGSSTIGSGSIKKISSSGVVTTFATGLSLPRGLAFDSSGTLFVSDLLTRSIKKISSTGVVSTFVTSTEIGSPHDIAFDASGILFVSDYENGRIQKISSTGVVSTFVTGLAQPTTLAFAPSTSTSVPEPFTIVGTLIGGTAALRMRKKLKSSGKV